MERALGVGRELVDLLQQRKLLRLQRVAPRSKEVERLPVAEEDRLLTLMDDQLRTEVKVLDRVLPISPSYGNHYTIYTEKIKV